MFQSTHSLLFEIADWYIPDFKLFKVGTCEGMWQATPKSYIIVAVINNFSGNGHLDDVFEWFENSCKRDKKNLEVVEIINNRFFNHLINKRGFKKVNSKNVIKKIK